MRRLGNIYVSEGIPSGDISLLPYGNRMRLCEENSKYPTNVRTRAQLVCME